MTPVRRTQWRLVGLAIATALIVAGFWRLQKPPAPTGEVRFVVGHGESAHLVANHLRDQGLIPSPWSFLIWVKLIDRHHAIRSGVYHLPTPTTGLAIFRILHRGPPLFKITFPEGWTASQMAEQLEAHHITSAAGFLAAVKARQADGVLFPDTYLFPEDMPPENAVARMTQRFLEVAPSDMQTQAHALGLTYKQLIVLASIVEREVRWPDERPIIASIFLNRLKKHMRLESCATVEYALGSWKPKLSYNDTHIESPYNTYRHAGLPPGPICNPGLAALQAASHPAQSDNLFFFADANGVQHFSKTYADHLALQRKILHS